MKQNQMIERAFWSAVILSTASRLVDFVYLINKWNDYVPGKDAIELVIRILIGTLAKIIYLYLVIKSVEVIDIFYRSL